MRKFIQTVGLIGALLSASSALGQDREKEFTGDTLVMVDCSEDMNDLTYFGARNTLERFWDYLRTVKEKSGRTIVGYSFAEKTEQSEWYPNEDDHYQVRHNLQTIAPDSETNPAHSTTLVEIINKADIRFPADQLRKVVFLAQDSPAVSGLQRDLKSSSKNKVAPDMNLFQFAKSNNTEFVVYALDPEGDGCDYTYQAPVYCVPSEQLYDQLITMDEF